MRREHREGVRRATQLALFSLGEAELEELGRDDEGLTLYAEYARTLEPQDDRSAISEVCHELPSNEGSRREHLTEASSPYRPGVGDRSREPAEG